MAKIKVLGNVLAIVSEAKLEDLKRVKRFRPEALVLRDKEGEPTFEVGVSCCGGGFGQCCVVFDCTNGEEGFACVTADLPKIPDGKNVRDYLADEIGGIVTNLGKIEAGLPAVIEEINAEHAAAAAAVEIL